MEMYVSKYQLVAEQIRQAIDDGVYHHGKKLPTIKEFAEMLDVSHMTVKKAFDVLTNMGYIDRRQGSGVYVKMNPGHLKKRIPISGNSSRFPKGSLKTKLVKFDITHPTSEIASKLQIEESSFIYDIERVRVYRGRPIIMEYVFMPIDVVPGINESILEDSIYKHIRETLKRTISSSVFSITGVRPSSEDMNHLGLEPTDFLMQIVQTVYFDDGTAFEYSIDRHVPDEFIYSNIETDMR